LKRCTIPSLQILFLEILINLKIEVPSLKAALENLKSEAVIRSTKNKELLSKRMMEFRLEISALRNNPYAAGRRRSIFSDENTASLIDIHG